MSRLWRPRIDRKGIHRLDKTRKMKGRNGVEKRAGYSVKFNYLDLKKKKKKQRNSNMRGGEMAQGLRALTVLPEDPCSSPSTHKAAHDCLKL